MTFQTGLRRRIKVLRCGLRRYVLSDYRRTKRSRIGRMLAARHVGCGFVSIVRLRGSRDARTGHRPGTTTQHTTERRTVTICPSGPSSSELRVHIERTTLSCVCARRPFRASNHSSARTLGRGVHVRTTNAKSRAQSAMREPHSGSRTPCTDACKGAQAPLINVPSPTISHHLPSSPAISAISGPSPAISRPRCPLAVRWLSATPHKAGRCDMWAGG